MFLSRPRLAVVLLLSYCLTPVVAWGKHLGDALSPAQQAALTKDMVWPEWQVVDGQKVLVPKLYVAHQTQNNDNNKGARIVGADVAITTRELENAGTLQASNSLAINASGKVSGGGSYSGGKAVAIVASSVDLKSASIQSGGWLNIDTVGDMTLTSTQIKAAGDAQAPSFPTYTRQELVYGQVEDQMRSAEESKAKLITQREGLITQQLNLERQKSQLLEQGLGSGSVDVSKIQNQVKALDQKIGDISGQVNALTNKVAVQDGYIQEARQYLKSQAQGSLADGEQWLKDFYQQRTQMYPTEAKRYQLELESLLKQYREEQKAKSK